ncbi:MAG TPA: hypothetical protein IAA32_07135 [Candidatus Butyricicoccus stercorigallinarum]|nr:hypothetical protein [Candidatus Butyricicoccus stercorigallinarum]
MKDVEKCTDTAKRADFSFKRGGKTIDNNGKKDDNNKIIIHMTILLAEFRLPLATG